MLHHAGVFASQKAKGFDTTSHCINLYRSKERIDLFLRFLEEHRHFQTKVKAIIALSSFQVYSRLVLPSLLEGLPFSF